MAGIERAIFIRDVTLPYRRAEFTDSGGMASSLAPPSRPGPGPARFHIP